MAVVSVDGSVFPDDDYRGIDCVLAIALMTLHVESVSQ